MDSAGDGHGLSVRSRARSHFGVPSGAMTLLENGRWVLLLACAFGAAACDEKKETASDKPAPSAAAGPSVVMPAPPPAPEPAPEPPKKKEPKVCPPPAKVFDFGGNGVLEAQLRLKLSKQKGDIMTSELGKVKSLNLSQTKMDELDPCLFRHLTGLKELFLGPGKLEDLSPLADLKNLESLRASLNQVADIKPLGGMTKMDRLDLGHTLVADLSPLAGMESLTELQLDDTQVKDLAPLAKLTKLERLSLQRSAVRDLKPLLPLTSLKFLDISGAPVDDKFVLGPLVSRGLKITDN